LAQEAPPPLEPDPSGLDRNRFIAFQVPEETQSFGPTAIRIHGTEMMRPQPTCAFGAHDIPATWGFFDDLILFAGPPAEYPESSLGDEVFKVSVAQCTPHYQDWSTIGLLHVTGPAIAPASTFHAEQLANSCEGRENDTNCMPGGPEVSDQLQIETTHCWADVAVPFNPPHPSIQPNISDVSALVDKFRNAPGAPSKVYGILAGAPGNPWGEITPQGLTEDFGFSHISTCVDTYRGAAYPYMPGKCAGDDAPCRSNGDCSVAARPCVLYCP